MISSISCNYVDSYFRSFENSRVTFSGNVLDSEFSVPVENVMVTLYVGDETYISTTNGVGDFLFENVITGNGKLNFKHALYQDTIANVAIHLYPDYSRHLLRKKNVVPDVMLITFKPDTLVACDQALEFYFAAEDSTGGIEKIIISIDSMHIFSKSYEQYIIYDSFPYRFLSPGNYVVNMTVIGSNADTSNAAIPLLTPENRSPHITHIRTGEDGFISNEFGYYEIEIHDPDNNFSHLSIDWGDASPVERVKDTADAHWHKYNVLIDTTFNVLVSVVDSAGASEDTLIRCDVHLPTAPILDTRVVCEPSQYLLPEDTTVTLGVNILGFEGSIAEIIWFVNRYTPVEKMARLRSSPEREIVGEDGGIVVYTFSTSKFKAINDVEIIVIDSNGKQSKVIGTLYMAGQ